MGYVQKWIDLVKAHDNLTIEVRTKSANPSIWSKLDCSGAEERVIFAFTLSPAEALVYEHRTPPLFRRIESAAAAQQSGLRLRLCFDPMIYMDDWRESYGNMLTEVFAKINAHDLYDVSVGSFRISSDYMKKMKKAMPNSVITRFPYVITNGYYHYPQKLLDEMEGFMVQELTKYVGKEKIFQWQDQ